MIHQAAYCIEVMLVGPQGRIDPTDVVYHDRDGPCQQPWNNLFENHAGIPVHLHMPSEPRNAPG